jgi:hypothetical protein
MPVIRIRGRVIRGPELVKVTHLNHPIATWEDPDLGLKVIFVTTIKDSEVLVECHTNIWQRDTHKIALVKQAYDIARTSLDIMCFENGTGLLLQLDSLEDEQGTSLLAPLNPELAELATALRGHPADFGTIHAALATNAQLYLPLRDLIESITFFHRGSDRPFRAIEGLRKSFTPQNIADPKEARKQGWENLRQKLRVSREYISPMEIAVGPRHGDYASIPGQKTEEVTKRGWVIMNRFFEYLKRGEQPLPETEFPVL